MSSPDSSDNEFRDRESHQSRNGPWRPVDRSVWRRRGDNPKGVFLRFGFLLGGIIGDIFSSPLFMLFFALPAGASVVFTFALAYYIGGATYMSPIFIGIWTCVIVAGIVFLEKTGIAKNFEGWDLPIRRIVVLPVALLATLALFYFMILLAHSIR